MRGYWKYVGLAAAIYGLQVQVDSRALPGNSLTLEGRLDGSAIHDHHTVVRVRTLKGLEKLPSLLGRAPVSPVRIGGGKPHSGGHGDDVGDDTPTSEPGDPESAPTRIGEDENPASPKSGDDNGPPRIAGDQSAHSGSQASRLATHEAVAKNMIDYLRGIPEYASDEVSIIGGTAIMHYLPNYRVSEDVDFVVNRADTKGMKEQLPKLPNSPFQKDSDVLEYKSPSGDGDGVQIDLVPMKQAPYPIPAMKVSDLDAGSPLPYMEEADLLAWKINSCGLRASADKKLTDAMDAKMLLDNLTNGRSLTLNANQKGAISGVPLDDVIQALKDNGHPEADKKDWETRLGL